MPSKSSHAAHLEKSIKYANGLIKNAKKAKRIDIAREAAKNKKRLEDALVAQRALDFFYQNRNVRTLNKADFTKRVRKFMLEFHPNKNPNRNQGNRRYENMMRQIYNKRNIVKRFKNW